MRWLSRCSHPHGFSPFRMPQCVPWIAAANSRGSIGAQLVQGKAELTEEAAWQLPAAADAFGEAEYLLDAFIGERVMPE